MLEQKILLTSAYQSKSMIQMSTCSWRIAPWNDNTLKEKLKFQLHLHLWLQLQKWGMGWGDGNWTHNDLGWLVYLSFYYCNIVFNLVTKNNNFKEHWEIDDKIFHQSLYDKFDWDFSIHIFVKITHCTENEVFHYRFFQ